MQAINKAPDNKPLDPDTSKGRPYLTVREKGARALRALYASASDTVTSDPLLDSIGGTNLSEMGNVVKGFDEIAKELGVPVDSFVIRSDRRPRTYTKGPRLQEVLRLLAGQLELAQ